MAPVQKGRADDVEIRGPLGWSLRANGQQVILLISMAIIAGLSLWLLREHDLRANATQTAASVEHRQQFEQLVMQQARLQEGLDNVVYLLSLSPEERAKLKLDMPPALRTKLLLQERPR